MSDRMYRDEVGAAVERLESLQDENARLRAELDRLDAPKRRCARARYFATVGVLFGVALALAASGFSHGFSCPHRTSSHRHSFAPQRTQRAPDVRPRAPEFATVTGAQMDDCTIEYFYDGNNVKRYKPGCSDDRFE